MEKNSLIMGSVLVIIQESLIFIVIHYLFHLYFLLCFAYLEK